MLRSDSVTNSMVEQSDKNLIPEEKMQKDSGYRYETVTHCFGILPVNTILPIKQNN